MTGKPVPYQEAVRSLLRDSVLDAMRELLRAHNWSAVTMSAVATSAGVSRQTLYNEFGSRAGLAQAYALRLADLLVDAVDTSVYTHRGDAHAALLHSFTSFFLTSATDPLVQSLLSPDAPVDLLRLVTTDSAPLVERASTRLRETFERSWIAASPADAKIVSRAIVRLALSYVSMPPDSATNVSHDMAALLTPFIDTVTDNRGLSRMSD